MAKTDKKYKDMLAELAEIVEWFESGQADLDEAIEKYQTAAQLINQMEDYLKSAENKIKKITENS